MNQILLDNKTSEIKSPLEGPQTVKQAFLDYLKSNPENVKNLNIPGNLYRVFVPEHIYELAQNSNNVDVIALKNSENSVELLVVEHNFPQELTDPTEWESYISNKNSESVKVGESNIVIFPPVPGKINEFHVAYLNEINKGILTINDKLLMKLTLGLVENEDLLMVENFEGVSNKGLGKSFYKETLSEIAKAMGFRFIVGTNNSNNLDFYTEVIGRYQLVELKEDKLEELVGKGDYDTWYMTVQFLYPEDVAKFVKPEAIRKAFRNIE